MAESNLKEMMMDEPEDCLDDESQVIDRGPKLKWYLIDSERTFCKIWDFNITLLIMYTVNVTPFLLVFPSVYQTCNNPENMTDCKFVESYQKSLRNIEIVIDILIFIDILMNFFKKTRAHKELKTIGLNYLTGYFIFDIIATLPGLMTNQGLEYY